MPKKHKKWLLGLGFDHQDGHKRITHSKNFLLLGGSKETHEEMREKAIKLDEELKKISKDLNDVSKKQFDDIAHKLNWHPLKSKRFS